MKRSFAITISLRDIEIYLREKGLISGPMRCREIHVNTDQSVTVLQEELPLTKDQKEFLATEIKSLNLSNASRGLKKYISSLPDGIKTFGDVYTAVLKKEIILCGVKQTDGAFQRLFDEKGLKDMELWD